MTITIASTWLTSHQDILSKLLPAGEDFPLLFVPTFSSDLNEDEINAVRRSFSVHLQLRNLKRLSAYTDPYSITVVEVIKGVIAWHEEGEDEATAKQTSSNCWLASKSAVKPEASSASRSAAWSAAWSVAKFSAESSYWAAESAYWAAHQEAKATRTGSEISLNSDPSIEDLAKLDNYRWEAEMLVGLVTKAARPK